MNKSQQPILLNCDWLGLSVLFDFTAGWDKPTGGHFFVDMDGTNVWKRRRILFNEYCEKVATILYEPKSSIIDQRAGLIEIANEWLYHGIGVQRILRILDECRPFVINGISRLDLCVDFNPTDSQWDIIQRLANGTAYVSGKRNGSGFWSSCTNQKLAERYQGHRIPHCQSWGHKTTAVKWKLYYKSKELLDELGGVWWGKPYIVDCWKEAGIDPRDAWRLEVSLKNCNQLDYNGQPLTWSNWTKCRPQTLFAGLYTQRFQVHAAEGHKDKSNDALLEFLPIKYGGELRCAKPKGTVQRNGRITLLRHLVQSLETHEVLLDDDSRESVLWHIADIVERNGLESYFEMMVGEALVDYTEQRRIEAADLRAAGCDALLDDNRRATQYDTMLYVATQLEKEREHNTNL